MNQDTKYIERAWLRYLAMVVPGDASQVQISETRLAFYAGATVLFSILTSDAFFDGDPGDIKDIDPTDRDLLRMESIQREVDIYGTEIDTKVLGIKRH